MPFLPQGIFLTQGLNPGVLPSQTDALASESPGRPSLLNKSIIHRTHENLAATLSESISPTKYNNFHTLSSFHQSLLYRAALQSTATGLVSSLYLLEDGSGEKQTSERISYRLHKCTRMSALAPSQFVIIWDVYLLRIAKKGSS